MNSRTRLVIAAVLAASAIALWLFFNHGSQDESVAVRSVAVRELAEYLARTFPADRVLVLANPFINDPRQPKSIRVMEDAALRALKKALGDSKVVTAFPQLRPGAQENPQAFIVESETTTPLSFLIAPDAIDTLVKQHPDCKIIVSLIGLPVELNRVSAWSEPTGPKFALLLPDLRMIGNSAAIGAAMKSGKLVAFVLNKPGAKMDEQMSGVEAHVVFERSFLLVTPDNIEAFIQLDPRPFESSGGLAR
ncbi:MAG: hypothetical protein EXS31_03345 [Pedosphaera sp.]|nr:hypothetical protein [Pedosphaera sp.]